jgi:hypothetical protein
MKHSLILTGLIVCSAFALAIWRISDLPLQPARQSVARVVAIVPGEGRLRANRDRIVVRTAHGTGQFEMPHSDIRCDVGDEVPVEQQGITLTRLPKTCR